MHNKFFIVAASIALLSTAAIGNADTQVVPPAMAAASANNRFAFDLLNTLGHSDTTGGNLFISPISITQAVGLLYAGSSGETKAQIATALHWENTTDSSFRGNSLALLQSLNSSAQGVDLRIANALWAQSGRPFSTRFRDTAAKYFLAEAKEVDFDKPSIASAQINHWVSTKTEGNIPQLVTPGAIDHASSVLTNAVYFKGAWKDTFDPALTQPADFHLLDGTTVQMPTMHRNGAVQCSISPSMTVVSLPYAGTPATSMIIVLPPDGVSPQELVSSLDSDSLNSLLSQTSEKQVNLFLPKFHVEYADDLTDALQSMGIKRAFTHDAQLGGMGIPNNYVSGVIHKAVVDVDEQGTVAAAIMVPKTIRIDHPFLCAIRDDNTGALLFLGEINKPEAAN